MKRIIIFSTILFLILSLIIGLIISGYTQPNVIQNSAIILVTGILLFITQSIRLNDAFRMSLTILFTVLGLIQFIIGFFAPSVKENNWFIILALVLLFAEIILLFITNLISKKSK